MTFMIEKIVSAFSLTFNACVDRLIDALDKKFTTRIECQGGEIFELAKKVDHLEKSCKLLEASNASLQEKIVNLSSKSANVVNSCDDLEQHSKGVNLLIHGLPHANPGQPETNLSDTVVCFLNSKLGIHRDTRR